MRPQKCFPRLEETTCKLFRAKREITLIARGIATHETLLARARHCARPHPRALDSQGIKKGVMELADLVVINKADGELEGPARHSAIDVRHALQLVRARSDHWKPKVKRCSALMGKGVDKVWAQAEEFRQIMEGSGETANKRAVQARRWMWSQVQQQLLAGIKEAYGLSGAGGGSAGGVNGEEDMGSGPGQATVARADVGPFSPSSPSSFLNLSLDNALGENGVDTALVNGAMTPREAARMLVRKYLNGERSGGTCDL